MRTQVFWMGKGLLFVVATFVDLEDAQIVQGGGRMVRVGVYARLRETVLRERTRYIWRTLVHITPGAANTADAQVRLHLFSNPLQVKCNNQHCDSSAVNLHS